MTLAGRQKISGKELLLLFACTLLVRVVCLVVLRSWQFPDEWSFGYEMGRLGATLASGEGFVLTPDRPSPSALFPPLYPLIVGGFFSLFGVYSKAAAVGLFLFQSACAGVIAVCLVILGAHLFNATAGRVASLLWTVYPTSLFYSVVHIWYCELALMLLLLTITAAVTARSALAFHQVALLGGLSGLTVLTDSTMTLYFPLLLLWMLLTRRGQPAKLGVMVAIWGITAATVVSPWIVRNWLVLGSPTLLKSNFGKELFTGNSPFSSGANDRTEMARTYAALDQNEFTYYQRQPELVYNRYLRDKALEWIRAHPFAFVSLTARRVSYFWGRIPTLGQRSWLHVAYFGPLLILALYGLVHGVRRRHPLAPIWLFLLVYPLPYYLTHVARARYRYPVEPLVVLLAAIPLAVWSWQARQPAREHEALSGPLSSNVHPSSLASLQGSAADHPENSR
ncbi:MAG TPA: hypothetical protein VNP04_08385 [Alphaproteobacteria bacterium]|nr:hypothetical protein [Alphaproteobacteria bacterium]